MSLIYGAFGLIRTHLRDILIRLVPFWIVLVLIPYVALLSNFMPDPIEAPQMFFVTTVVGVVLSAIIGACLAVVWHRTVLRPEQPMVSVSTASRYILAFILLTLLLVALLIIPGILAGTVVASAMSSGDPWVFRAFNVVVFLVSVVIGWVWLRFSLVLPAAAVGDRDMGFGQSLALTGMYGRALWAAAAFEAAVWTLAEAFENSLLISVALQGFIALFALALASFMYRDTASTQKGLET